MERAIRCMAVRGGTSKGLYFLASDLPSDIPTRDAVLLAAMGSPDIRQIDGMGGADPLTSKVAAAVGPDGTHANWMENFPWTRLASSPAEGDKPMINPNYLRSLPPFEIRQEIDDGTYGGVLQRNDADMLAIWQVAVEETRVLIDRW